MTGAVPAVYAGVGASVAAGGAARFVAGDFAVSVATAAEIVVVVVGTDADADANVNAVAISLVIAVDAFAVDSGIDAEC